MKNAYRNQCIRNVCKLSFDDSFLKFVLLTLAVQFYRKINIIVCHNAFFFFMERNTKGLTK